MVDIEQLDGRPAAVEAVIEGLLREYLMWCAERLRADCGVVFDDLDSALSAHYREFAQELPRLLTSHGRLLVARTGIEVVGVGALKPVDATVAEVKRMYVHPSARGRGVGRAILERLLTDARTIGYRVVRLETLCFMHQAHALYRSMGFEEISIFARSEVSLSGLEPFTLFMQRRLGAAGRGGSDQRARADDSNEPGKRGRFTSTPACQRESARVSAGGPRRSREQVG